MYKLVIQFNDGSMFNNSQLKEASLKAILKNGVRGVVSWAKVVTPSGVSRDVTKVLQSA